MAFRVAESLRSFGPTLRVLRPYRRNLMRSRDDREPNLEDKLGVF